MLQRVTPRATISMQLCPQFTRQCGDGPPHCPKGAKQHVRKDNWAKLLTLKRHPAGGHQAWCVPDAALAWPRAAQHRRAADHRGRDRCWHGIPACARHYPRRPQRMCAPTLPVHARDTCSHTEEGTHKQAIDRHNQDAPSSCATAGRHSPSQPGLQRLEPWQNHADCLVHASRHTNVNVQHR